MLFGLGSVAAASGELRPRRRPRPRSTRLVACGRSEEAWRFPLVAAAPARLTRPNGPFINGLRTSRKSTKRTEEKERPEADPRVTKCRTPRLARRHCKHIKLCEGQSYSPTLQLFSPTRGLSHKVPRARALASTSTRSGPLTAHLVRGDCKLVAKMEHTSPSPGVHR